MGLEVRTRTELRDAGRRLPEVPPGPFPGVGPATTGSPSRPSHRDLGSLGARRPAEPALHFRADFVPGREVPRASLPALNLHRRCQDRGAGERHSVQGLLRAGCNQAGLDEHCKRLPPLFSSRPEFKAPSAHPFPQADFRETISTGPLLHRDFWGQQHLHLYPHAGWLGLRHQQITL